MKLKTAEEESSSAGRVDLVVTDLGGTLVKTDEAIMAAVRRTPLGQHLAQPRH